MPGELIKIEKPAPCKEDEFAVLQATPEQQHEIRQALLKTEQPKYLYWTELKRKSWIPETIRPESFWSLTKAVRMLRKIETPIKSHPDQQAFSWIKCAHYEPVLHKIDLNMGGRLLGLNAISEQKRQKYVSRSLIEESIASAQLEGAHTTREAAQKMIREGRPPADLGQRMIYNNYRAMRLIEEELRNEKLTIENLLSLHAVLTADTLENTSQAGRLRTDDERITVSSPLDGKIAHVPPPVSFVKEEITRLIAWANDELDEGGFTHPLVKAIALHFWVGYLHPFADGNGRLARALFYWYMLHKDYWAFAFFPISTRIKKSPKQYVYAYIHSEQDDCDLTYFIDYNIRQIELARKDFEAYVEKKAGEGEKFAQIAKALPDMNDRQIQLVHYLLSHPDERTNVTSMTRLYGVTAATAVKDLKSLQGEGYLVSRRKGRNVFYYPTDKLLKLDS